MVQVPRTIVGPCPNSRCGLRVAGRTGGGNGRPPAVITAEPTASGFRIRTCGGQEDGRRLEATGGPAPTILNPYKHLRSLYLSFRSVPQCSWTGRRRDPARRRRARPRAPPAVPSGREGPEQPLVPRPRAPRPVRPSRRDARLVPSYNVRRHRICFVGLVSADII